MTGRKRRWFTGLAALIIGAVLLVSGALPAEAAGSSVNRTLNGQTWTERDLSGSDRFKTAAQIAEAYAEITGARPTEAILVYSHGFADALAACSLAGHKRCPIIISKRNTLNADTKKLLTETWQYSVKKVTMVGGGFEPAMINDLKSSCKVSVDTTTYAGANRYETAEKVAGALYDAGIRTCAVATGWKPADSLSMSSWSYAFRIPILFVDKAGNIAGGTNTLALARKFEHVYILGATGAVSAKTETDIDNYSGRLEARIGGANRWETSRLIAQNFLAHYAGKSGNYQGAVVARGANANFPDALVGGPLAGEQQAAVILVDTSGMEDGFRLYVREGISNGYVKRLDFLGAAAQGAVRSNLIGQLS